MRALPPSIEAMNWAMLARGVTPIQWRVLVNLCHHVSGRRGDFDVWPSHQRLADDAEISVATVKRALRELADLGFLRIMPSRRKDGGRGVNVYRLQVRVRREMPDGERVVDPDTPLGQNELGGCADDLGPPVTGELGAQVTAELCTEPLDSEPLDIEPSGESASASARATDLFGEPVVDPAEAFEQSVVDRFETGWAALKADYPRIAGMRDGLGDDRKGSLLARLSERKAGTSIPAGIALVDEMLERVRGCPFYCGEVKDFAVTPDWALGPQNFRKIMERPNERELARGGPIANNAGAALSAVRQLRQGGGGERRV